jgi:plasmid stabilization system protein ParE
MKAYWTIMAVNRLQRLQQLHDYLAEKEPVAILFVERLARLADGLCRDPEAGYPLPYFGEAEVRELIDGTYRVIYRVLEDEIHILTVRHVPRLLPARAFER